MKRYLHYITKHVFGRIKIRLEDLQADETYCLDMPEEVFNKMLEIMTEFKNHTYKAED